MDIFVTCCVYANFIWRPRHKTVILHQSKSMFRSAPGLKRTNLSCKVPGWALPCRISAHCKTQIADLSVCQEWLPSLYSGLSRELNNTYFGNCRQANRAKTVYLGSIKGLPWEGDGCLEWGWTLLIDWPCRWSDSKWCLSQRNIDHPAGAATNLSKLQSILVMSSFALLLIFTCT